MTGFQTHHIKEIDMIRRHAPDDYDGDLFDTGRHARETRANAYAAAMPRRQRRRDAIELHVAGCGARGATRWEIADALAIPYTSVCAPVLDLLTSGRLRETPQTRPTAYGSPAAVIVSALLLEGRDDG
jgi:hypothetical protein